MPQPRPWNERSGGRVFRSLPLAAPGVGSPDRISRKETS